jgi:phosphoglycerol transferase
MKTVAKFAAAYGTAAGLSLLLLVWALRLDRAELSIPFQYEGDSLQVEALVKGVVENGWYLHNPRLGAPFGQEMYDFPLDETLHLGLMKLLSLACHNYVVVLNLYYLLGYPLAAVTALFAFRRFGLSYAPSVLGALLFTFLPYHFMRGEAHLFLSSYYLVPLEVLVVLWLYLDRGLFLRWDEAAQAPRCDLFGRPALGAAAVCLLTSLGGVYYAFFTCALLGLAGVACAYRRRRLYPFGNAAGLIALICLGVFVNLMPTFWYTHRHGPNPEVAQRLPLEAERYGLRVIQLLLPVPGHRVPQLAALAERYRTKGSESFHENNFACLGTIGSLGFLYLIGRLFFRRNGRTDRLKDGLTVLNIAAVLLASIGSFGAVFNLLVSPAIRCYNRVSVFIGLLSLFAVAMLLDRVVRHVRMPWARQLYYSFLVILLFGGTWDQSRSRSHVPTLNHIPPGGTSLYRFLMNVRPTYGAVRAQFAADAEFVGRIEAALPHGAAVFQLPMVPYPEAAAPIVAMDGYDHFRGYLHSRHLRWSYGCMKGRLGDRWCRVVAELPVDQMVERLTKTGFGGIYVNRTGYTDRAAALEAALSELLGAAPEVSLGGDQSFFKLGAYAHPGRRSSCQQSASAANAR